MNNLSVGDKLQVTYDTLFQEPQSSLVSIVKILKGMYILENGLTVTSALQPFNFIGSVELSSKDTK